MATVTATSSAAAPRSVFLFLLPVDLLQDPTGADADGQGADQPNDMRFDAVIFEPFIREAGAGHESQPIERVLKCIFTHRNLPIGQPRASFAQDRGARASLRRRGRAAPRRS